MAETMDIILSRFYKFLVESVPYMVTKSTSEAMKYETIDSRRNGDIYIAATLKTDNFWTYPTYDETVLRNAGFTEPEIKKYKKDKMAIPQNKRDTVIRFAREQFLETYVETNTYYRMLHGLPPINENGEVEEEIWFEDFSMYEKYGLEPCPIHEIPSKYLIAMESRGELEELKKLHPDAKYINYMGSRRIDIVTARRADNFTMLSFPNNNESYSFYRNFLTYYEECREYFLTIIYNKFFSGKYDQYDGFIGFMILVMCINRMISGNFKAFIERDFYDDLVVKTFLNAYGLHYDNRFTLSQMKLIAKNLNILLRKKSTDEAILDVLDLLGYNEYSLMKYLLVREQSFDENGKPVFAYKTVTDEEGNEKEVLDPENMYSYKFVKTNVKENNIQQALHDTTAYCNYTSITAPDPYWIEDEELKQKLNDMKFNYIETKYMDLSIVYRMYAIFFETVYFTRMILDKRNETSAVKINLARLSYDDIPLFDVMIFLICVTCKYYGMKPSLLKSPSKILHIYGFDFTQDLDAIRKEIEDNPRLYDNRLLKYLNDTIFTKPSDVNDMYANIKGFDSLMAELLNTAETLESYRAYRKLYDTLMMEKLNNDIYALPDGTIPETFVEYLEAYSPVLMEHYNGLNSKDDCSIMIGYVTERLLAIFTNTKYLQYIQILDQYLIDAIVKVLCFFKSYTVDLIGVNVILLYDSRIHNAAHFYHKVDENGIIEINDYSSSDSFLWDTIRRMQITILESVGDERSYIDLLGRFRHVMTSPEYATFVGKMKECIATMNLHDDSEHPLVYDDMTNWDELLQDIVSHATIDDPAKMNALATDIIRLLLSVGIYGYTGVGKYYQYTNICNMIINETATGSCEDATMVEDLVRFEPLLSPILRLVTSETMQNLVTNGHYHQFVRVDDILKSGFSIWADCMKVLVEDPMRIFSFINDIMRLATYSGIENVVGEMEKYYYIPFKHILQDDVANGRCSDDTYTDYKAYIYPCINFIANIITSSGIKNVTGNMRNDCPIIFKHILQDGVANGRCSDDTYTDYKTNTYEYLFNDTNVLTYNKLVDGKSIQQYPYQRLVTKDTHDYFNPTNYCDDKLYTSYDLSVASQIMQNFYYVLFVSKLIGYSDEQIMDMFLWKDDADSKEKMFHTYKLQTTEITKTPRWYFRITPDRVTLDDSRGLQFIWE